MKKIYFYLMAGLIFFCSCGSDDSENAGKTKDNKIIEIEPGNNQDQTQNGTNITDQHQTMLDSQFAAFLAKFKREGLPYKVKPKDKLNYEKIPFELQVQFLLKAEGLDRSELDQMQNYAKFYYLSHPVSTPKFNAIIYARSEMGSSYYILCTFDNQGKLISFIDFAMHQVMGAGPQAGQEFSMTGSIDKNLIVKTVADKETKNYQIQDDGKIIKK
jgi:hypothetical protein